jgi:hypothetical protein
MDTIRPIRTAQACKAALAEADALLALDRLSKEQDERHDDLSRRMGFQGVTHCHQSAITEVDCPHGQA